MKIEELKGLLTEIAAKDLSEGSDLHDHPCSVAVKVMGAYEDDVDFLIDVINGRANKKSKRAMTLIAMGRPKEY